MLSFFTPNHRNYQRVYKLLTASIVNSNHCLYMCSFYVQNTTKYLPILLHQQQLRLIKTPKDHQQKKELTINKLFSVNKYPRKQLK